MTDRIEDDLPPHSVERTLAGFARPARTHPPRVLILYGSLRARSFSRLLAELLLRDQEPVLSERYSEAKERRAHGALEPALGVAPKE